MKRKRIVLAVAAALAVEPFVFRPAAALELISNAPITFERNLGQFEPDVLFVTRGVRGHIAIRAGEVSVAPANHRAMRLALAGANPRPRVEALEPRATRSNYYRGPSGTAITGVPHYGRVLIKGVYPRVDLAFHGERDALEYDFLLAPGADPSAIRLDLSAADEVRIDEQGNLRIHVAGNELTQKAPIAFQVLDGRKVPVEARFELRETVAGTEAGFVTAAYDRAQPLVIDPVLSFATYLGASGTDWGGFLQSDTQGNLHLAYADSEQGAANITVSKFDPVTREMMFSTRIDGLHATELRGLAVGSSGTGPVTYVAGATDSPLFTPCATCPPLAGGTDAFVMALDANGQVVGSRLIGGSGDDFGLAVATDSLGNVYVTGNTGSPDFPVTTGAYRGGASDGFVTRLSPDLETVQRSAFLGGSGADSTHGIAVDPAGNMYVTMASTSLDFPTPTAAAGRNFIARLNASGTMVWSNPANLGSTLDVVTVDDESRPVVGGTQPTATGPRAFVVRLNPGVGFPTFQEALGASGSHEVHGIATQGDNIFLTGKVDGPSFLAVAAPQPAVGSSGAGDAFVARFGITGLEFATLIGGTGSDSGHGVAVAPSGVYVAGSTASANFPTVNPERGVRAGASDGFLAGLGREFNWASPDPIRLREDEVNVPFKLTRTGSLDQPASVRWTAVNGTALNGTHFGTPGVTTPLTGIVDFPAGVGAVTFRMGESFSSSPGIRIINDGVAADGPRSFTIVLSQPTGGPVLGATTTKAVTIVPDATSITVATQNVSVPESAGSAIVTISRQGSSSGSASVQYTTANGTALAGQHYAATSGTLTWNSGDFSARNVVIPLIDNGVANASRTFRLNLGGASGAPVTGQTYATVTIVDDEDTVGFTASSVSANESTSVVTLRVRRTGGLATASSVTWSTTDGTAVSGVDFGSAGQMLPQAGVLQWAAGESAEKTIDIPILPNTTPQGPRAFTVTLGDVQGAALGIASANVTLSDNDAGFMFGAPTYGGAEGASVTLQVLRVGSASAAASVQWTAAGGSATQGSDFTATGGTLSWAAGNATPKTIVIPLPQDTADEGTETFTVTLHSPSAGTSIGTPGSATVSIADDDIPAESLVSFSAPKYLVMENGGTATITLKRDPIGGGFTVPATVSYSTAAGTALATSDFTTKSGTVTWDAADGTDKTISIAVVNNATSEPHESFKVRLSSPTPGVTLDATEATVTIVDDDDAFPRFGALPEGWEMPAGADAGWHASNDPGAYDGVFSLRSDAIDDGQRAQVEVTRDFGAGNVTFRVKVSSEAGFDKLRFFIDDVEKGSWSGTAVPGWVSFATPVTAGTHTLRWSYEKDSSAAVGFDAAWIDAVVLP